METLRRFAESHRRQLHEGFVTQLTKALMRTLFLTFAILMTVNIYAQIDDPINQIGFEMNLADKSGSIASSANKLIKNEAELTLTVPTRICGFDSGISLVLGNGETIQNKNEKLVCEKTPRRKLQTFWQSLFGRSAL